MKFRPLVSGWILSLAICLGTVATWSGRAAENVLYRHHSLGSIGFLASTNGNLFRETWELPNAVLLRKQLEGQLAEVLIKEFLPTAAASNQVSRTAPLVADVLERETLVDVRGEGEKRSWVLAIQLPEPRRKAWDATLKGLAAEAKLAPGAEATLEGYPGWSLQATKLRLSWASAGDWLVAGIGAEPPAQLAAVLQEIRKSGRPAPALDGRWLEVNADLGELSKTFPVIPQFLSAKAELTLTPRSKNVRTEAKLRFAEPIPWHPEPWQLPLENVHDPIVGFAAARGIQPLLEKHPDLISLGLPALPNQACGWSLARIPYIAALACPMPQSSNVIFKALQGLPTLLTNYGRVAGQFIWATNSGQMAWQGLPFVGPTARPLMDGGREFLFASILPPPNTGRRPPEELFSFTNRADLAYYDWEITEERVNAWRYIYQIGLLVFGRISPDTNAPAQRLMEDLSHGERLGNCVTELAITGPSEMTFLRNSPVGLTGLEIVNALRWVGSANFPFTYERAPHLDLKKVGAERRAARATNGPAAQPGIPALPGLRPPPGGFRPGGTNGAPVRRTPTNSLTRPLPQPQSKPPAAGSPPNQP
ncbi:MAG TPA: hypothetical protein DCM86_14890 [Verrucomicrobiales bacterium]|nr:hypothetical protein [Verrucomicrobiales bacterium]